MMTWLPGASNWLMASKAALDQGTRAPTSPQAMPSRMRCLARSITEGGIFSSVVALIHSHSWLVTDGGSLLAASGWSAETIACCFLLSRSLISFPSSCLYHPYTLYTWTCLGWCISILFSASNGPLTPAKADEWHAAAGDRRPSDSPFDDATTDGYGWQQGVPAPPIC